jgi:hypothetical protein
MGGSTDSGAFDLPTVAAWEHVEARRGYEVVFFTAGADGLAIDGTTTGTEDGESWWVGYRIQLDGEWNTQQAEITGRSASGEHRRLLTTDGRGRWLVDGVHEPALDGCVDVDLESSACTNTVPIHRLDLQRDEIADAPAVFVRADDLRVERLEQRYRLGPDGRSGLGGHGAWKLAYEAPRFGADFDLTLDPHGLVLDYPHLAMRTA